MVSSQIHFLGKAHNSEANKIFHLFEDLIQFKQYEGK